MRHLIAIVAGTLQTHTHLKGEGGVQGGASEAHHPDATALGGIANLTDKGEGLLDN